MYSSSGRSHGTIDCTDALKYSCNYFFYELADKMKIEDIDRIAKGLGLGEATGVELYERLGHRSNPETKASLHSGDDARWYMGDQILTAIGQSENRFTPMQLCSYVNTIVNKGTRYQATFLNRVVSSDYRQVVLENTVRVMSEMEMSDEAWNAVKTGMEKVAHESGGTARSIFKDYPIKVAAKTGTAQTGDTSHSDNGAFVCYAPADDPQIAVVVYGERAGHGRSMGDVAKAVLDAYFGMNTSNDIVGENQVS
jgi:penicillin-binding protein 2